MMAILQVVIIMLFSRPMLFSFCDYSQKSLLESFHSAQVVITGTVVRISEKSVALIRLKRTVKGRYLVADRRQIVVGGFNDRRICKIKKRDTKIFFLWTDDEGGTFKLSTSPASILLKTLDFIGVVFHGRQFRRRKSFEPTFCEKTSCLYGAVCISHRNNRTDGKCICRTDCRRRRRTLMTRPVCGTDGMDYSNECFLAIRSCHTKSAVRVRAIGKCERPDPCSELHCSFGEQCRPSSDGLSAQCFCPDRCDNVGDSVNSRPVCGSDGCDYDSICLLNRAACSTRANISIKFYGRCDPCKSVVCPSGNVCKLDVHRNWQCRCLKQCRLTDAPVCASDGKTYRNECFMKVASCVAGQELRVFFDGRCEDVDNPCAQLKCSHGQQCFINDYKNASCQCPYICEPIMKPVCGTNGINYNNECELRRKKCTSEIHLGVRHLGACEQGVCVTYTGCRAPKVCREVENSPICTCPECDERLKEVCGSDGVTYANECKLQVHSCLSGMDVYQKYAGVCDGCSSLDCDYYSSCVTDGWGNGECQCPRIETCLASPQHPVCGTDGQTYANACILRVSACANQRFVMVASEGSCDSPIQPCIDGQCSCPDWCPSPLPDEQVCSTDMNIYESECQLRMAACANGMTFSVLPIKLCLQQLEIATLHNESCRCNRVGAYENDCDPEGRCHCRPGVGGPKCDHCLSRFWGIHLIASGMSGCRLCGCSTFGSRRSDCGQTSGRCMCKKGVQGEKCNSCKHQNHVLTADGCSREKASFSPKSCSDLHCIHTATCEMVNSLPICHCPEDCTSMIMIDNSTQVCGSDGRTYSNICSLLLTACQYQSDLVAIALGHCHDGRRKIRQRTQRRNEQKNAKKQRQKGLVDDPSLTESSHSFIPYFNGKGYLILPRMSSNAETILNVELWLKPRSLNGLVFYLGEYEQEKTGDFVSLILLEGVPWLYWDLGSGVATLGKALNPNRWSAVKFGRNGRKGTIQVDEGSIFSSHSLPGRKYLNLVNSSSNILIGGFPRYSFSSLFNSFENTYSGAVQRLVVNGEIFNQLLFTANSIVGNVDIYSGPPCINDVCKNRGVCEPFLNDFHCQCDVGYSGKRCQQFHETRTRNISNSAIFFDGLVVLPYRNRIKLSIKGQKKSHFSFEFRTNQNNGLIWWENIGRTFYGDYLAVVLINGRATLAFNLGSDLQQKQTTNGAKLADDNWHRIVIKRNKRRALISVDNLETMYFNSSAGSTELNTDGIVWLGGKDGIPVGFPALFHRNFVGCLRNVRIFGVELDFVADSIGNRTQPRFCQ